MRKIEGAAGTSLSRRLHAHEIFHAIRREPQISQRDIVRRTGFDKSTVSSIIAHFDERGLVIRMQGMRASRPGRPTEALSIAPTSGLLAGVQVEAEELGFIVAGLDGAPLAHHKVAFDGRVDGIEQRIARGVEIAVASSGRSMPISGIGISLPGLVSTDGVLVHAPILGWRDIAMVERLSTSLPAPVYVGNDVKAAAMAEHLFGSCVDVKDFIYLYSGSGVGGALMLGGEIYLGAKGFAGELGHIKVVPQGRLCSCGALGCLSAYLSEPALASEIAQASGVPVSSFDDILHRAGAGDPVALGALDQAGGILGTAVSSLINIFNPPVVALGGDMARGEIYLRAAFEQAVRRQAHPSMFAQTSVRFSEISALKPYLGGIALALDGVTGLGPSSVIP